MEKEIKNFDRTIEQMLSQQSVAPPFGAWNRIASELDAVPATAVTTSPATILPKRFLVSIISGVIIIGTSLVTAYLASNNKEAQTLTEPAAKIVSEQVSNVFPPTAQTVVSHHIQTTKHLAVKQNEVISAKDDLGTVADAYPETPKAIEAVESEIYVPNQAINQTNATNNQVYYFPPVDLNLPETKTQAVALKTEEEKPTDDKKVKAYSSSSNEQRIKFRKRKARKFSYGVLNRMH